MNVGGVYKVLVFFEGLLEVIVYWEKCCIFIFGGRVNWLVVYILVNNFSFMFM